MIIHAVLGNPNHPEYGVATIPFPIPHDQYAHCIVGAETYEVFTTSYAVVDIDGQMTEKELFSAAVSLRSVYAAFRVLRRCM